MPDEGGRDVVVAECVGGHPLFFPLGEKFGERGDLSRVSRGYYAVLERLVYLSVLNVPDECERDSVLLVKEQGVSDDVRGGVGKVDRVFPRVKCRVADHLVVACPPVLVPENLVVDVSGVHQVPLAKIVDGSDKCLVGRLLVLHYSVAAEPVIFKCIVQGGEYVL